MNRYTPPQSVVGLSLAKDFNNAVTLDLKYWEDKSYNSCTVDLFTTFILDSFIKNKTSDNTIDFIQMSLDKVNLKYFVDITEERL